VRQRLRRSRARDQPVSLSDLAEEDTPGTDANRSEADGKTWYPAVADLPDVIRGVRARAVLDPPVRQLLQLYELGVTRRLDILWAGMPRATHRAARKRLMHYAREALRTGPEPDLGGGTPGSASIDVPRRAVVHRACVAFGNSTSLSPSKCHKEALHR
jgi:hypothetical protein